MQDVGTKVKIKLVSSIIPTDGELETYEMWLQGSYVEKAGSCYLRYEEVQEEAHIRTTVKLANGQAFILRGGDVNMRLPLNMEQKENGHYESVYGTLPLVTKTYALAFEPNEGNIQGQFIAHYDLIVSGAVAGNYKLEIQYMEVQQ
ncbi:DUF1934 domain-containing protein [Metasolibacillus meyeri]|uniref:DUF1934 domain-containing protein n=1 Tax=Metasolibacillus meyeri TaxID=1071052 RepID=A0AAW9NIJ9_9BACL|nr:DUF1934 domain-containing protein [Metasolibacillus meyeri]MEC1176902.1 DUF1934 domain-containing protein [Metasolibacillus meyeri]